MAEPHYSQGDILFSCAVDPATGAITNNAKARAPSIRPWVSDPYFSEKIDFHRKSEASGKKQKNFLFKKTYFTKNTINEKNTPF